MRTRRICTLTQDRQRVNLNVRAPKKAVSYKSSIAKDIAGAACARVRAPVCSNPRVVLFPLSHSHGLCLSVFRLTVPLLFVLMAIWFLPLGRLSWHCGGAGVYCTDFLKIAALARTSSLHRLPYFYPHKKALCFACCERANIE